MSETPALDESLLRRRLGSCAFVSEVVVLERTGSTNDDALRLMERGAPEGTTVLASAQTAGRGRLGRTWHSTPGLGLYVSVLLRPKGAIPSLTRWTIAAALAACQACREIAGVPVEIEWPNDLMFRGRKVAGTLAELRSAGGAPTGLVLGTGFNVNQRPQDFPADVCDRAVSLRTASGREETLSREALAVSYLERLGDAADGLARGAWPDLVRAWLALAPAAMGAPVLVTATADSPAFPGLTRGLDDDGALLVEGPGGPLRRVRMSESVVAREEE